MKALYNSIKFVSAAILMVAAGACTEEVPEYVKADVPEGAQAFFVDVPSSFDLTDGDGTIEVTAFRGNTSSDATVGLTSEADAIFSVPSSVNFAAGSESSVITISYDPDKVVPETPYSFTLTLADNTTPYGASSCSFTAGAVTPQLLKDFAVATFTEGWWGEEHRHTIKYREEGNVRYCIVEAAEVCEGGGDGAPCAGGVWGTGVDFEFIWYLDDDDDPTTVELLEVPGQFMGWQNSGFDVYLYDYYHFWVDNMKEPALSGVSFFDFAKNFSENYPIGYYDENGGFYFTLRYMVPGAGAGMGWTSDPYDVVAVCDGFTRTTDYNEDIEYSALYDGESASMMFSEDGTTALKFAQSVRYNEEAKDSLAVEYYLPNYFKEGFGLAFKAPAPHLLKDGDEIADVDNKQETGLVMFGNKLYVNVKGGSVSFPNGSEFPVFTLKVAVYSLDEDGNKTYDFDRFEEVITALAYGRDYYTPDMLAGLSKADYCRDYTMIFSDSNGTYESWLTIEDAGKNAEGVELVKISNLTALSDYYKWDDSLYAEYDGGVLYMICPPCINPFPYNGVNYNFTGYPVDPESGVWYTGGLPLIAGYIETDGVVAIVGAPGYEAFRGMYFYDMEQEMGLTMNYDYILIPQADGSSSVKKAPLNKAPMLSGAEFKSVEKTSRKINASSAVPYVKSARNISSAEKLNLVF